MKNLKTLAELILPPDKMRYENGDSVIGKCGETILTPNRCGFGLMVLGVELRIKV
jgi:hypothetical protein